MQGDHRGPVFERRKRRLARGRDGFSVFEDDRETVRGGEHSLDDGGALAGSRASANSSW